MRPVELPAVRDAMLTMLSSERFGRDAAGLDRSNEDRLARCLAVAELYWVAAPMEALAHEVAARDIHEMRWLPEDRPAPCGYLYSDGDGLGDLPVWRTGHTAPAAAASWGPHPDGLALTWWTTRAHLAEARTIQLPRHAPPLWPAGAIVLPVDGEYRPLRAVSPPLLQAPLAYLQAAWLLMDMPGISDVTTTPAAGATHAAATAGTTHTAPAVTVIHIRRQHPNDHGTTDPDPHWHHRWVVRLHPRWQACGPGHTEHRRILVAPHIKGPAGAPLLHRDHVTAWIR